MADSRFSRFPVCQDDLDHVVGYGRGERSAAAFAIRLAMPGEDGQYETIAGFVIMQQGKIPRAGDHFE
jgi:CBS domain containing-hemolysin-like protein